MTTWQETKIEELQAGDRFQYRQAKRWSNAHVFVEVIDLDPSLLHIVLSHAYGNTAVRRGTAVRKAVAGTAVCKAVA